MFDSTSSSNSPLDEKSIADLVTTYIQLCNEFTTPEVVKIMLKSPHYKLVTDLMPVLGAISSKYADLDAKLKEQQPQLIAKILGGTSEKSLPPKEEKKLEVANVPKQPESTDAQVIPLSLAQTQSRKRKTPPPEPAAPMKKNVVPTPNTLTHSTQASLSSSSSPSSTATIMRMSAFHRPVKPTTTPRVTPTSQHPATTLPVVTPASNPPVSLPHLANSALLMSSSAASLFAPPVLQSVPFMRVMIPNAGVMIPNTMQAYPPYPFNFNLNIQTAAPYTISSVPQPSLVPSVLNMPPLR